MITTVAVGTDGSATAKAAVEEAAEIARRFDASSCSERVHNSSGRHNEEQDIELQWAVSSSARVTAILERIEADSGASGIECETRVDDGEPAEVLVRLAADCGADLLVIGNRGMQRRVLGSVPDTVTHKAGCSVLVVKTT